MVDFARFFCAVANCDELGILFNRQMYDDLLTYLHLNVGWEPTEAGQPTPVERRASTEANAILQNEKNMADIKTLVFHQRSQMLAYFNSSDVPFVTTSSLDEAGSPILSSDEIGSTPKGVRAG